MICVCRHRIHHHIPCVRLTCFHLAFGLMKSSCCLLHQAFIKYILHMLVILECQNRQLASRLSMVKDLLSFQLLLLLASVSLQTVGNGLRMSQYRWTFGYNQPITKYFVAGMCHAWCHSKNCQAMCSIYKLTFFLYRIELNLIELIWTELNFIELMVSCDTLLAGFQHSRKKSK